jgi:hypothetical protein
MRVYYCFLFGLILLVQAVYSQKPNLKDWKLNALPTENKLEALNHSNNDWKFIIIDKEAKIVKNSYDYFKGDKLPFSKEFMLTKLSKLHQIRSAKKIDNGYIVGINNGEFGGSLWFVSTDGLTSYQLSNRLNIVEIFEYQSRLFAIEGLSHMGFARGTLIEIYLDSIWKFKVVKKLPNSPITIDRYKDHFVIVGNENIFKIDKDLNITYVLRSPFYWGVLYPSSIVFHKKNAFIAMRAGILKIQDFEAAPKYEWYVPKN